MVTKITLFEPHFDGAQFGPTSLPDDILPGDTATDEDESADPQSETESGTGLGRMRLLAAVGALTAGLLAGAFAVRRLRGRGTPEEDTADTDIETESEEELAVA